MMEKWKIDGKIDPVSKWLHKSAYDFLFNLYLSILYHFLDIGMSLFINLELT